MNTWICLLRGVNVGGKSVKMSDLEALFITLGHSGVRTYIQSGNVVFRSATRTATTLAREIEDVIARHLGLGVTVVLRSPEELGAILRGNPFLQHGADPITLHVTLLVDEPDPSVIRELVVPDAGRDEYRIVGREVYLRCPDGYGSSKLSNAFWERSLGAPATTRNWRTLIKLFELASSP